MNRRSTGRSASCCRPLFVGRPNPYFPLAQAWTSSLPRRNSECLPAFFFGFLGKDAVRSFSDFGLYDIISFHLFCSFPAQDSCQDTFSKAMSAPFVRKLPMDVAARIFEFGERLLGPILTAPTKCQVHVSTIPIGRPPNHGNVYFEFCMFEYVSHKAVLTEKRGLIHQVMWFMDSMISSTSPHRRVIWN